jgi:hypothetical protein
VIKYLLDSPCVFCGYCAAGFYQPNTHKPNCPWRSVGGLVEREESVRTAIRRLIVERDRLRAALEKVEEVAGECPWCHWTVTEGHTHKPDCARQLALTTPAPIAATDVIRDERRKEAEEGTEEDHPEVEGIEIESNFQRDCRYR